MSEQKKVNVETEWARMQIEAQKASEPQFIPYKQYTSTNELPALGVVTVKEGQKFDQNKPDLSMVSWELMKSVGEVRQFGAKKYDRDNWKKGFKVTRSLAASLRHIFLFLSGETNDPESGLSHLAHAVCGLEHAIYDMINHPENDDRFKK